MRIGGADPDTMGGLAKGLAVIEAFSAERPKLTIADAARIAGLERATARRCLLTLLKAGYAEFDGKFYRLTPRVLRLGLSYMATTPLPAILAPVLTRLAAETGESCSATILDDTEIVYVARASQKRVMSIGLGVGSRLPAYCTSMGRVLLAALEPAAALEIIERSDRRKLTPHTRVDPAVIMTELSIARSEGCCLVEEELEIGLRSLAVPVFAASGRVAAAMNVGAQSQQVSADAMRTRMLPLLRAAQDDLARMLI
ncbi:MAG: helix-turn-helix domain-containing protein [Rhizobiaceae bacterium]|nr:helix-turn-helix domain-containing protein [Rhizobiaceae bacterium]